MTLLINYNQKIFEMAPQQLYTSEFFEKVMPWCYYI